MKKEDRENFRYTVDEFADIKIMRYRVDGWEKLSLQEKEYAWHLSEAAKWGRDIAYDQNFEYNLLIRKTIEKMIEAYDGSDDEEYSKFMAYAKRVFFSNGIHHHYSEEKFVPECSLDFFCRLMAKAGVPEDAISGRMVPLMYDASSYRYRRYSGGENSGSGHGADADIVTASSVNFYKGVTRKEAEEFYSAMIDKNDRHPVSYGLNSRLVKESGVISEEVYRERGKYGPAISKIIEHLMAAREVAGTEDRKRYIDKLVEYYRTGDLRTWDEYNILWVKDKDSTVDFVNGFIEDYTDPLGMKATWEALVNFKDKEASLRTETICANAQWFEDNSPVDSRFKKEKVQGLSAKVINAVCLGGDCYPAAPIGINLPNSDWIRKEYGSKSVTIANLTDAYDKSALEYPRSILSKFSYDEEEVSLVKKYGTLTNNIHTDLHECLGHGSGKLLPGVPQNALKDVSSSLEEARADLFALYYIADDKLLQLGVLPDKDAYKAEYANYIRNGLMTQLVRIELGKNLAQAHMQARSLISQWCYRHGLVGNVIGKLRRGGKTYFRINDYEGLRKLFGKLLAEIQRIKSEGDYEAGRALIDEYAVKIDYDLHKEVLERYSSLGLRPYGGFINPEIVPVMENGEVVDYRIEYCSDYLAQMMRYGKEYSAL